MSNSTITHAPGGEIPRVTPQNAGPVLEAYTRHPVPADLIDSLGEVPKERGKNVMRPDVTLDGEPTEWYVFWFKGEICWTLWQIDLPCMFDWCMGHDPASDQSWDDLTHYTEGVHTPDNTFGKFYEDYDEVTVRIDADGTSDLSVRVALEGEFDLEDIDKVEDYYRRVVALMHSQANHARDLGAQVAAATAEANL